MKDDIQRRLLKEYEGLSLEERRRLIKERVDADPILGPFWKKIGPDKEES